MTTQMEPSQNHSKSRQPVIQYRITSLLWVCVAFATFFAGYRLGLIRGGEAADETRQIESAFLDRMNWDRDDYYEFVRKYLDNQSTTKDSDQFSVNRPPPSLAKEFNNFQQATNRE